MPENFVNLIQVNVPSPALATIAARKLSTDNRYWSSNAMKHTLTISCLAAGVLAATSLPAQAYEAGDWVVRGRIINVNPNDDSGAVSLNGSPIAGSGVSVDDDTVLEVDFTYMLHRNWGLELILATSEHNADGSGSLAGVDLLDSDVLPPTLTLQYHFLPGNNIRPYAGIGINYTHFYNEDGKGGFSAFDVDIDDSWGLAAQAGVDVDLNKDWFVNFDVKYIDIDTTAKLTSGSTVYKADVDIDPWVWGIGIGTSF
jgi:outer membrane protein